MIKKPTDELMKDLLSSNNIELYLKENEQHFVNVTIAEFLNEYVNAKQLVKSQIFKEAEMNEIYGYQIFSASRTPSRDKLISLCIGMGMSLDEIQATLKVAGFAALYPKSKKDSIIIHGISAGRKVFEINTDLYNNSEESL